MKKLSIKKMVVISALVLSGVLLISCDGGGSDERVEVVIPQSLMAGDEISFSSGGARYVFDIISSTRLNNQETDREFNYTYVGSSASGTLDLDISSSYLVGNPALSALSAELEDTTSLLSQVVNSLGEDPSDSQLQALVDAVSSNVFLSYNGNGEAFIVNELSLFTSSQQDRLSLSGSEINITSAGNLFLTGRTIGGIENVEDLAINK